MSNRLTIPDSSIPQFEELYVISDLHLGGPPGFQIFNSGAELERLINHLRARPEESRVALLINGDFVDFLAERPSMHFDPAGAVEKLDRIATKDPAFKPIFDALKTFAATENRSLIINLGNHDLELALPWVRDHLMSILSKNNEAARGRITLAFDGAGYLCRVGKSRVLCVHGNEVDTWNVADYETIRKFGREVVQGRPVESWIPNAGSQLVVDVMNDLKSRYPFVDLLKPEMGAVIPTLIALAPDQRSKISAINAIVRRKLVDWAKIKTGFLGAEEAEGELTGRTVEMAGFAAAMNPSMQDVAGSGLAHLSGNGSVDDDRRRQAAAMLDKAEERLNRGISPMSLIPGDHRGEFLGFTSALWELFTGGETVEVLRKALEKLGEDRSFEPNEPDTTYTTLDERIGDTADFLIAGHTHLERALQRKQGRGWYFNSGTWARLIKLEKKILDSETEFEKVFKVFAKGTMEALDTLEKLVMHKLTVVTILADGDRTFGELRHVSEDLSGEVFLKPKDDKFRFPKS